MKNEDRITEILSSNGEIKKETLEKIEESVPALSERQKDKIYDLVMKKKYEDKTEKDNDAEETENSISIVTENRRNNIMIKLVAAAACICLVFGSVVFTNEKKYDDSERFDKVNTTTVFDTSEKYTDYAVTSVSENEKDPAKAVTVVEKVSVTDYTGSTADTGKAPESTQSSEVSTAETETTTDTSAVIETNAELPEAKRSTVEEAAHKLTDNYWDYECFFASYARTRADFENSDSIKLNYTMHYGDWGTSDIELTYCRTIDERLTEKTMDGLKKLYNTYYGKNYDPYYSANAEYTNNYALFGPSFTADTLPADGKIDLNYAYIEYEGELYQNSAGTDWDTHYWSDDQIEVTDVTEDSFTLKRKFGYTRNGEDVENHGDVTFRIVFDEDAQDWRIEQKDVEYDW